MAKVKRFIVAALVLALAACAAPVPPPTALPTETPMPTPTPVASVFRVVGYVTDAVIVETVPFDLLTHINYAFLVPNDDGTFQPLANRWKIKKLIEQAHQHQVKVVISVGGWGWDAQFEQVAADPQKRAVFIAELTRLVEEIGFDGADLDWEYPDPGASAQNFLALVTELRAALPPGKLLTAAVISYGDETALGIPAEVFPLMDYINVMAYDGSDHASMAQFEKGLAYWLGRGLPPEKLVMGVPFYSHPDSVIYKKLVAFDPAAAQNDRFVYNGVEQVYNGIPTIEEKTHIALEQASGIMIWTIEQDAPGDASLLAAINRAVSASKP